VFCVFVVNAIVAGKFSLVTASSDHTARLWVKDKCVKILQGQLKLISFMLLSSIFRKMKRGAAIFPIRFQWHMQGSALSVDFHVATFTAT